MAKIICCKFDRDEIVIYRRKKELVDAHTLKKIEEDRKKIKKNDVIIIDTAFTNNAQFYLDTSCFEDHKMASNIKWAVVYQSAFLDACKKEQDIPPKLWALNEGDSLIKYKGMNKSYKKGDRLTVKLLGNIKSMYYYGHIQKVIVFTDQPEEGFTFYIIPVSSPQINFAYFENSEKNWQYGQSANLSVHYHNLCSEKNTPLYSQVFIVENTPSNQNLTAQEGEPLDLSTIQQASVWSSGENPMPEIDKKENGVNSFGKYTVLLDYENWRKGDLKEKQFSIIALVYKKDYSFIGKPLYIIQKFRNFLSDPTHNLYQYDSTTLLIKDVDNTENSISSRIRVQKDFMSEILARQEVQKSNMIQYIGDIEYNRREYDPCGYSKITIKDDDDPERQALVLFDEEDTTNPIDRTTKVFGIITGDERKNISITIDQLTTKDVFCQGLLLESGQKHNEFKNVFQVDKVYTAQKSKDKNKKSIYPEKKDDTHLEQLKKAKTPITQQNKKDYDVIRTDNSYNPSETQGWQEGIDYKFEGNDKILIMPKYMYNKTALESKQNHLNPLEKEALNTLWLFNYFILKEDLAQTYFLPISTCRYPNQIAKIKVYPDIEWEIAFLITIGTGYSGNIKYSRNRMNGYHKNFGFKYLHEELNINNTKTSNLGWSLKTKAAENGTEHEIGLEGIKKIIDTSIEAFNATRQYLEMFNPDNNDGTPSLAQSQQVIEIEFEIDPPNIGFALGWKFDKASNDEIVPIYTGGLRADPLIGLTISVDLVPLVRLLPYVGTAIDWLIKVITRITRSDIYITFEISTAVSGDLSFSYNKIDGFKNKEKQIMKVTPSVSIKTGCKSRDIIIIPSVTIGGINYPEQEVEKWKIEGNVASSFIFEKEWGYNKNKKMNYERSKVKFDGAKVTFIVNNIIDKRRVDYKIAYQENFILIPPSDDNAPIYDSNDVYIEIN
ncbi:hypothetical protein BWK63_05820 [Flavobacterium covae]|uniref:Uncharacterized protein n=1 Tax=Flavobacterium covae TaxID=2906076 RepID=A0ABW8PGL5_9FLAO|nr:MULTISPECIES: hypothetical protein [Flavobacterium]OWP81483.1 hypothetical protein BWK63_05820 [Flavobacterium covae]POR23124.1 hypothetical protein BWK57_03510 [Flavobacterium columnare]